MSLKEVVPRAAMKSSLAQKEGNESVTFPAKLSPSLNVNLTQFLKEV